MKHRKSRPRAIALLLVAAGVIAGAHAEVPVGWNVAGSAPKDFEFSRDPNEMQQGHNSTLIANKSGVVSGGFGTLMQTISAENYRGEHLRLSGYLKTKDAVRAQMWMRVDASDRTVASFDNMDDRPITGTTGWTRYEIVLNAPSNSADVAFGFLLTKGGKVWGSNFKLERADAATPLTASTPASTPREPQNLEFEPSAAASSSTEANASGAVTTPPLPTAQELAESGLYQFVTHHATEHYFDTGMERNLARWRGGMQSICPLTAGLSPEQNAFVSARLRALATYVGAPVQADPNCKRNVSIIFTNDPQQSMEGVIQWAGRYFRNRYAGGMKRLIEYKPDHAVQGWYLETSGGARALNTDVGLLGLSVLPLWPEITPNYHGDNALGSRLGAGSGSGVGIGVVILIVDTTKASSYSIETLADYLSMLTLSVAQTPDHCDPLPSILDLLSSNCGLRAPPTAITAGDLAFLKALYYRNTGLDPSPSRNDIQNNMMRQFKLR